MNIRLLIRFLEVATINICTIEENGPSFVNYFTIIKFLFEKMFY